MISTSVSHLSDAVLRRDLHAIVAQDRSTTARMLIHIAEFESRGLYRNEGYATMHLYCVGELGMSEDIAYKRTRAARKAREFPRIFLAIADGPLTQAHLEVVNKHVQGVNGITVGVVSLLAGLAIDGSGIDGEFKECGQ